MNPQLEQARELLSAAQRDRLTLRILLGNPQSPLESMLFHAQQALEKGLKAVLVAHGVVFRRTHDLIELLEAPDVSPDEAESAVLAAMEWAASEIGPT
jgi:HEPN domain-containing protein